MFFGNDQFSKIHLDRLFVEMKKCMLPTSGSVSSLTVVSSAKAEKSKFNLSLYANNVLKLPTASIQETEKEWLIEPLEQRQFDLAVVVSFGKFVPDATIKKFRLGGINVHPSLLPRGSCPIQHTILNRDMETGVSIIELDPKKFDVGSILSQSVVNLEETGAMGYNFSELRDFLAIKGSNDLVKTLENITEQKSNAQKQQGKASFAKMIRPDLLLFNPLLTKNENYLRFKATGKPLITSFESNSRKFRVVLHELLDPNVCSDPVNENGLVIPSPGLIYYEHLFDKDRLYIGVDDGWLVCTRLQLENKKPVKPADFVNGYHIHSLTSKFE